MTIANVRQYVGAWENGAQWSSFFFKTGAPAALAAGRWVDLSMGAGIPTYNAYVGGQLESTALVGTANKSIYPGAPAASGQKKYLWGAGASTAAAAVPATLMCADYLMFYPLVDGDNTDLQETITVNTLPRYASGDGVMAAIVCTTPMTGNATLVMSYTNQAGVSGRTSSSTIIFSTTVGNICSSSNTSAAAGSVSPFLPLQSGDTGIRSIESFTLASPSGGLFSVVLVKPLANILLREQNVYREIQFFKEMSVLPEIQNGAFLNFFALCGTTTSLTLRGELQFIWG